MHKGTKPDSRTAGGGGKDLSGKLRGQGQPRPPKGKDKTGNKSRAQLKRWAETRAMRARGRPDDWTLDALIPDLPGMFTIWRKALKLSAVKAGGLIGLSARHAQRLDTEGHSLSVTIRRAMLDALAEKHMKDIRRKTVQKYLAKE